MFSGVSVFPLLGALYIPRPGADDPHDKLLFPGVVVAH